jgi:hypothetical protein
MGSLISIIEFFNAANLKRIVIIISIVAAVACGWKLRDYQAKSDILTALKESDINYAKQLKARDDKEAAIFGHANALEKQLSALKEMVDAAAFQLEDAYEKEPVYSSCMLPAGGVQAINARIKMRYTSSGSAQRSTVVSGVK